MPWFSLDENDLPALKELAGERRKERGSRPANYLRRRGQEKEPNVSDTVVAAIYAPTGGIVCPFGLTIAMAENAYENGVEFKMNTEVVQIEKADFGYRLITNNVRCMQKYVVNAAGVYADVFLIW